MGRNTERKGKIACYEQFLLFPQCFQETCTAETKACHEFAKNIDPYQPVQSDKACQGLMKLVGFFRFAVCKRTFYVIIRLVVRQNGFNPLPDKKILDWSKLKQTADDILKCM